LAMLKAFVQAVTQNQLALRGLIVTQHAKELGRHFFTEDTAIDVHSLAKSYLSLAIGILIDEGRLSLDDPVLAYLAADIPPFMDSHFHALRIRHLLTMTAGRARPVMLSHQRRLIADENWARYFLSVPLDAVPGTLFCYDTGCSYLLSCIIRAVCAEDVAALLQRRLFDIIGVPQPLWLRCPRGIPVGGGGLFLTTAQLVPFGQLLLNHGVYNQTSIVSEKWIRQATAKQVDTSMRSTADLQMGYGYHFVMNAPGGYRADGAFGQFCIVLPEKDACIAVTSQVENSQDVLDLLWAHVLPLL
jgi:CubicO group peptidase (beta-lactamase class C family)